MTKVTNGFSLFDPRITNLERTLCDLGPLLQLYADTPKPLGSTRLSDLREILKKGARLAFSLFAQPCFWKFDWSSPLPPQFPSGSPDCVREKGESNVNRDHGGPAARFEHDRGGISSLSGGDSGTVDKKDVVVWPALLQVVDKEGVHVLTEKLP